MRKERKQKYLRGMDVENNLNGAFAQMKIYSTELSPKAAAKKGLHRNEIKYKDPEKQKEYEQFLESHDSDTREYYAVMFWEKRQRDTLIKLCEKHGITIENPNKHRAHVDTDDYAKEQSTSETIKYNRQLTEDLENEKSRLEKNNEELEAQKSELEEKLKSSEKTLALQKRNEMELNRKISEIKENKELMDAIKKEKKYLEELKSDTNLQMQNARKQVEEELLEKINSANNDKLVAKDLLRNAKSQKNEAQEKLDTVNSYLEGERKKIQKIESEKSKTELQEEKRSLIRNIQQTFSKDKAKLEEEYSKKNVDLDIEKKKVEAKKLNIESEQKQKSEELEKREERIKTSEKNFYDIAWKKFEKAVIPDTESVEIKLPIPTPSMTARRMYNEARVVVAKLQQFFSKKIKTLNSVISNLKGKIVELKKDSDELAELKKPFHKEWKMRNGDNLKLNLPCGGKEAMNAMADMIYDWETDTPQHNLEKTRQHQKERERNREYQRSR